MPRVELADLLGVYPAIETLNFQTVIARKKEFFELEALPTEQKPVAPEKYFRNQKFIHRYLRWYNDILLLDDTGTGKTRSVAGLTEYYHNHKSHIKGAFIIVSGDTQMQEFKRQLSSGCSDVYSQENMKGKTERAQRGALNREIAKWYHIMTYKGFVKFVNKHFPLGSNKELKEYFSGYIFFIDEIQNIKIDVKTIEKKVERGDIYSTIWRVFKLAESCKRILASATPMMNDVSEIVSVLNLILPLHLQIADSFSVKLPQMTGVTEGVVFNHLDPETATLEELRPFLQGRISYIRASDSGAIPFYGDDKPSAPVTLSDGTVFKPQQIVHNCYMSPHQSEIYRKVSGDLNKSNLLGNESASQGMFTPSIQSCNFTYPDGSIGGQKSDGKSILQNSGFYKYMRYEQQGDNSYSRWVATEEFKKHIRSKGEVHPTLQEMSAKTHEGIKLCLTPEAKCYIYFSFVQAGVLTFGACLEEFGFERFRAKESPFQKETTPDDIDACILGIDKPIDNAQDVEELGVLPKRKIKDSIPPYKSGVQKYRYAIIYRNTSEAERAAIFELYNSPENVDGRYIKVILVSPVGQFGINLYDVKIVILYGPEWSPAASYQSMTRAFRALSHAYLLSLIKDYLIRNDQYTGQKITVNINVYFLVSLQNIENKYYETIESIMYKKAELKDIQIKRMMRMLKQASVNCYINRKRNIRPGIDGTPSCDYTVCEYKCMDPDPVGPGSDTSTYDVYYTNDLVASIVAKIVDYFHSRTAATLDDLVNVTQSHEKYVIMALEYIIKNNIKILDRFGFTSYLREDKDVFYLSRIHPRIEGKVNFASEYYSRNLIGVSQTPIQKVAFEYETRTSSQLFNEILQSDGSSDAITRILTTQTQAVKSKIFEEAVLNLLREPSNSRLYQISQAIVNSFDTSYIRIEEPLDLLGTEANKTTTSSKVQSLAPTPSMKARATLPDIVWIHNIDLFSKSNSEYSHNTRINNSQGTLRILKQKEGVWRYLELPHEIAVYSKFMSDKMRDINRKKREMHSITGTLSGNKFTLSIAPRTERASGMECFHYKRPILWDIMWKLGIPPEATGADKDIDAIFPKKADFVIPKMLKREELRPEYSVWVNAIDGIYKYIVGLNSDADSQKVPVKDQLKFIEGTPQYVDVLEGLATLYRIDGGIDPSVKITLSPSFLIDVILRSKNPQVKQLLEVWKDKLREVYKSIKVSSA